ncbi:MAG: OmpA family protein [Hydrocarboniphaga sp.]|uniref:OmpA family protein n=1 Tax=Hydrocarboniphaga sp. TaxID=2033016 RepID=UPI002620AA02|nr:OmpA family protein [Hydrocarboniphaga sp.]MDB5971628.1 OmpA family protein [Hydrocarboniphaga sp.]
MNRKKAYYTAALAAIVGGLVSVPVFATEGPYIGARVGANKAGTQTYDWNGRQTILPVPQQPIPVEDQLMDNTGESIADYKYKTGLVFGYVGGYSFANGLRPEFEIDFRQDKPKSIDFLTAGAINSNNDSTQHVALDSTSAFINLWYDFFPSSSFHPYLGGGGGVIRYTMNHFRENVVATGRHTDGTVISVITPVLEDTRRSDDATFAYQGGAGIRYDFNEQLTIGLDYRYVKGGTGQFYVYRLQPETHFDADYQAQSVFLSVDWYFHKKPAPVAPPAPAVVAVAPPPPDTDGDGVIDDLDKCPGTPLGTPVDDKGCPLPPPPPPCKAPQAGERVSLAGCGTGDVIVLRGVNFEFDKARLTPNAKLILDSVGDELVANPQINVELGGHTDSKGSDEYNQVLSDKRANSVVQYLVGRGVDSSRMTAVGYGETQPVADNDTDEGRELNRRVELKIVGASADGSMAVPVKAPADPAPADAPAPEAENPLSNATP